jgi:thiol-disulfide isomerase/thioredoxin
MVARSISAGLDVLTGLLALVLFLAVDNYFHIAADLRTAVVSLAALYLCAGLIRGRSGSVWLKGLLVSGGGALVLGILLWAQIFHAVLAILLLTVLLFGLCGVRARHYWTAHSAAGAGLMVLVPLAALTTVALATFPALAARIATRTTVAPAPAFEVSRVDGSLVRSTDWRGHVVVLPYWATWCPACRREMPELERLYRQYQRDPNVIFWAVDVQENGETPERAKVFLQKAGYTLPMAVDSRNSVEQLALADFPSLIVIDRAGRVRFVHTGYDGSEDLQGNLSREIDALLKEPL